MNNKYKKMLKQTSVKQGYLKIIFSYIKDGFISLINYIGMENLMILLYCIVLIVLSIFNMYMLCPNMFLTEFKVELFFESPMDFFFLAICGFVVSLIETLALGVILVFIIFFTMDVYKLAYSIPVIFHKRRLPLTKEELEKLNIENIEDFFDFVLYICSCKPKFYKHRIFIYSIKDDILQLMKLYYQNQKDISKINFDMFFEKCPEELNDYLNKCPEFLRIYLEGKI